MRNHHIRLAACSALVVLATAACSSGGGGTANTPGVTSTTITIGSTQPLTGVAAPGYSEIAPASKAMFDYINAAGGINGRKIIYKYVDDGYNPTNTVSQTQKLILQDKVFGVFNALGTPTHEKVIDFLNQNKVPDLFVASGCLCWDNPSQHKYTFGWQTDYTVEGKILGDYLKKNFAGKKIAYFYQADDFGQDGIKGLDMELPSSQVVSKQSYQPTNINISSQVGKLAASKADVVVSFSVAVGGAAAGSFDPNWSKNQPRSGGVATGSGPVVPVAGASADASAGAVGVGSADGSGRAKGCGVATGGAVGGG